MANTFSFYKDSPEDKYYRFRTSSLERSPEKMTSFLRANRIRKYKNSTIKPNSPTNQSPKRVYSVIEVRVSTVSTSTPVVLVTKIDWSAPVLVITSAGATLPDCIKNRSFATA